MVPWPWQKKKKFNAYKALDTPDIQIVAVEYDDNPVWLAVGTPKSRKTQIGAELGTDRFGVDRAVEKDEIHWEHLVSPNNLPSFLPIEKAKEFMQGVIAQTHGTFSPLLYSGNPILYRSESPVSENIKDLDIPDAKVEAVADLTAKFFVKQKKEKTKD